LTLTGCGGGFGGGGDLQAASAMHATANNKIGLIRIELLP
jgi:hypothetical protein